MVYALGGSCWAELGNARQSQAEVGRVGWNWAELKGTKGGSYRSCEVTLLVFDKALPMAMYLRVGGQVLNSVGVGGVDGSR